ncbi:unnamed protein product [Moneuplotes crassus]|uniref:Uncharacterized protein n=1 Tax=Euplotes crassus TaxID=5936 RepID=A0AAD1U897_EUPCR|nr:unnamed protein product [Moneuplotes crassus]
MDKNCSLRVALSTPSNSPTDIDTSNEGKTSCEKDIFNISFGTKVNQVKEDKFLEIKEQPSFNPHSQFGVKVLSPQNSVEFPEQPVEQNSFLSPFDKENDQGRSNSAGGISCSVINPSSISHKKKVRNDRTWRYLKNKQMGLKYKEEKKKGASSLEDILSDKDFIVMSLPKSTTSVSEGVDSKKNIDKKNSKSSGKPGFLVEKTEKNSKSCACVIF